MKNYTTIKKRLLKDKIIRKEYNNLGSEFKLIQEIIERRLKKGLTQTQLARKLKTKQSAIARLESGRCNPTVSFLQHVAKALDSELNKSSQ
jgi:predicted transcriptional regulator